MDIDEFTTFRNERINSNVGRSIAYEDIPMNTSHKNFVTIKYWRLPTTPRNYDCINPIGCITYNGEPPNVNGQPIPGRWYPVKFIDISKLTKLEEQGNAKIYGYM